ncbi:hypothetical protein E2C01_095666 [Portunus trituberculatus]|uniref:Uncharacterized protein n=1 Tax=Portunus trituberculatus TaxID=210409 RepID=A0A5B7K4L3_PORTR|nr:hypothetical protein [Portunus trituberculatus]
MLPLLSAS